MIIDAKDLIVGRMGAVIAKKALLGEKIEIVNCEKAVITGTKSRIMKEFIRKRRMGIHSKGPFFHRQPYRLVKRIIRGMLPYKEPLGREALKRIICHNGIPENLKNQKTETISNANLNKLPNVKYMRLEEIAKLLGAK